MYLTALLFGAYGGNEYEKNNHLLINAFYDVHVFCNSICIRFFGQAESELSNISDKIVTAVNDVYSDKNISITAEDINYDSAFKIYVDTNVFKLSTNVAGEIENALENGNYIYLLPIDTVNGTVVVNFQKGLPLSENAKAILSEEEQQEVLDNAGKWSFLALHYTKMEIQTMI